MQALWVIAALAVGQVADGAPSKTPEVSPHVVELIRGLESDVVVRRRSALEQASGRLPGSELLLPPLTKMLEDEDPLLAAAAPAALLRVSYDLLLTRKPKLVELLADGEVRHLAGAALMLLKEEAADVVPKLAEFSLTGASHDSHSNRFQYYLSRLPESTLIQYSAHEDKHVRGMAIAALRENYRARRSENLANEYLGATHSPLPEHRKLGIDLYSFQNPTWEGQKAQLKRLLEDDDKDVRATAEKVLDSFPQPTSLEILRMLDSPRPHVRVRAVDLVTVEILADIGNDRLFIEGIKSEDADFARACLRALGRAKHSPASQALAKSLLDPDYPHRDLAIETAGYLEHAGATMPALTQMFEQNYASRSAIVAAWTTMGPQAKSALPLLHARFDVDNVDASADALDAILAIDASDVAARIVMERYSQLLASRKTKEGGTKYDNKGYQICIRLQKHGRRSQWAIAAVQEFLRHAEKSWETSHALKAIEAMGPDAASAIPVLEKMLEDAKHMKHCDQIRETMTQISEGGDFAFKAQVAPSEE